MSTLALKRNYQLEMPKSFVNVENEEMEYIDGGFYYLSNSDVVGLVSSVIMAGAPITVAALAAQLGGATGLIAALIPGIGWAAAGIIAANAVAFSWACVNAIGDGKGVDISFGFPTGLKFTVK